MMKKNIVFLYIVYCLVIYLLLLIDLTILMYYIFWVINIFIYPLIWLWIKILYYNRTILLLLLFYYFIAKYTIKEPGYKYFQFFNINIEKWQWIFWNYIWSITTYHIEIVSIFLFFFVIMTPLILHSKEVFLLICSLIIIIVLLGRIFKSRWKYIKEKKIRIRSFFFFSLITLIFIKITNYQYIKDFYTMYIHMDKWVFELLEWKIQMYNKTIEKDYFAETVGLKPIWVGDKINKKEIIDNKLWDYLLKKKKHNIINQLKYKIKRTKYKYYLYIKYHEKVLNVKTGQNMKKMEEYNKEMLLKDKLSLKKKFDNIKIKEYSPRINTKNENPVVTQEKEKERALHRFVLTSLIHKFSINNYYRLNSLLKDLTSNKLYYQPFIDKKGIHKHRIEEKKYFFYNNIKERFNLKDDILFLKKLIARIKKDQQLANSINKKNNYNDYFIKKKTIESFLNYLIVEKKPKSKSNLLLKLLNMEEKKINKRKEKLNIKKFLKNSTNNIKIKSDTNKFLYFNESKLNIISKDTIGVKKHPFCSFPVYVEKKDLEKMDNRLLYNTVKKYNEEKTKVGWKNEFSDHFILKENKENLKFSDSPDLSRRNKK